MEYTIYCCFPHTRGKFTKSLMDANVYNAFPPYAGEVYRSRLRTRRRRRVSPIRGGSLPEIPLSNATDRGFPHTRGKFTDFDYQTALIVEFPPYAGEVY